MSPLKSNSLTETDLIKGCLEGKRHAQKALFEMYAGKMLSVCKRYSRNQQEAEDILQDGFIKVFRNLQSFDYAGSFEGWVRRIMINTALKLVSKKSFQNEQIGIEDYAHESVLPEVFHTPDYGQPPETFPATEIIDSWKTDGDPSGEFGD